MRIRLSELRRVIVEASTFVKYVAHIKQARDEFAEMMQHDYHDSWPDEGKDPNVEEREFSTREEAEAWGEKRADQLNSVDYDSEVSYEYYVVGIGPKGRRTTL